MYLRLAVGYVVGCLGWICLAPVVVIYLPVVLFMMAAAKIGSLLSFSARRQMMSLTQTYRHDKLFGCHVPIPGRGYFFGGFWYVHGPHGWRGSVSPQDAQVIVLGDSMAYGAHVDENKTYFGMSARSPRVVPVANSNWSMVHEVLALERLEPEALRKKLVVWFVYVGNDLGDNLSPTTGDGHRQPFLCEDKSGAWKIVTEHLEATDDIRFHAGGGIHKDEGSYLSYLKSIHRDGYFSRRAFSAAAYLVERAQSHLAKLDAKLVVLSIPAAPELLKKRWHFGVGRALGFWDLHGHTIAKDYPHRCLSELCAKLDVRFVNGLEEFSLWDTLFPFDEHLSERGNKTVRRLLNRLWNDTGSDGAQGRN